jgi:uncharacterized membrane protein
MSSALSEYGPLAVFLLVTGAGIFLATPQGEKVLTTYSKTRRMLLGTLLVQLGGLMASAWTWVIHNQLSGTGYSGFCAAEGIVQCGSVIGDATYSEAPILGLPWGVVGLLGFSLLGYLTSAVFMGVEEDWSKKWVDWAYWVSIIGLPGVAWLVVVELFLVDGAPHICPFCTSVHISMVATFVILHFIRKDRDDGEWNIKPKV